MARKNSSGWRNKNVRIRERRPHADGKDGKPDADLKKHNYDAEKHACFPKTRPSTGSRNTQKTRWQMGILIPADDFPIGYSPGLARIAPLHDRCALTGWSIVSRPPPA
jgi:hypothetical protein